MRWLVISWLVACAFRLAAQDLIDISGEWVGNSSFAGTQFHLTFSIDQQGSQIDGTSITVSLDGKDSVVVAITGVIDGSKVDVYAQEILHKQGSGCMSNSVLTFSATDASRSLIGKWKGDMRLTTCPPLVGGDINLYQVVRETPVPKLEAVEVAPMLDDDRLGNTLVAELSRRKYYALMIGVADYRDQSVAQLEHPLNDARQLTEVLQAHYSFTPENIRMLSNPTRGDVIEAFDKLRGEVTEKDHLLVFYAGHGVWDEELNQGYWLPADASLRSKSNWISNSTIRDYIRGIPSQHTLLISDACFSGGILRERAAFENSRAILELYKMPSRKAMTSGTLKTVPDKSVFIEYLLKRLRENDQPLLSADQLFRSFKMAVINNSPNGQVPQYGPIWQAGDEGGDFIFLRKTRD